MNIYLYIVRKFEIISEKLKKKIDLVFYITKKI